MTSTWACGQHKQTVTATLASTLWCHLQNLKYFVDAPSKAKSDNQSSDNPAKLELLKSITGYSAPGVLTALMGGSGQSPPCPTLTRAVTCCLLSLTALTIALVD